MIQQQEQVNLDQTYTKILHFCPALDQTYVMLAIKHHRTQVLSQIDSNGKIIRERVFYDSDLEQFCMLNDKLVLILDTSSNLIIQWNLDANKFIQVPFLFSDDQNVETCQLYMFPETQTFCICELGNCNNNFFKLSYFNYPLKSSLQIPIVIFQQQEIWDHTHIVRKGNNHSLVCWAKIQLQQEPIIRTFRLTNVAEGTYNEYDLSETQTWDQQLKKIDVSIGNMWEIRPQQMILVCMTGQPYNQSQQQYPNTNFIYSMNKRTLRRANFTFAGKYQNQHIDSLFFGKISMFRSYDFEKGAPKSTPVYYINNQNQEIIFEEYWKCNHLSKYQFLGDTPNTLIQCLYENGHVNRIVVKKKEVLSLEILIIQLVSGLIPKCCQDLALSVVNLII